MLRCIVRRMSRQKVRRCAPDDAAACVAISIAAGEERENIPMITISRGSDGEGIVSAVHGLQLVKRRIVLMCLEGELYSNKAWSRYSSRHRDLLFVSL